MVATGQARTSSLFKIKVIKVREKARTLVHMEGGVKIMLKTEVARYLARARPLHSGTISMRPMQS